MAHSRGPRICMRHICFQGVSGGSGPHAYEPSTPSVGQQSTGMWYILEGTGEPDTSCMCVTGIYIGLRRQSGKWQGPARTSMGG